MTDFLGILYENYWSLKSSEHFIVLSRNVIQVSDFQKIIFCNKLNLTITLNFNYYLGLEMETLCLVVGQDQQKYQELR